MISSSLIVISTVQDKTGYSLTAGSYSIHQSSVQRVSVTLADTVATNTAAISAITRVNATANFLGQEVPSTTPDARAAYTRCNIPTTTTVNATRETSSGGNVIVNLDVPEWT